MDDARIETSDAHSEKSRKKSIKKLLRKKWARSPWRVLPLPIIAYSIVGTYLWSVGEADAWQRAAAPVIAVMIFRTLSPQIYRTWAKYTRNQIEKEERDL